MRTGLGGDVSLKRVEEPEIDLQFMKNLEEGYNVVGTGKNEFGCYTIAGTLSKESKLQVFREYDNQKAAAASRRGSQDGIGGRQSMKVIENSSYQWNGGIQAYSRSSSNVSVLPLYSNNAKAEENSKSRFSMRRRALRTPSYLLDQPKGPRNMSEAMHKCHKLLGQLCSVKERSILFLAPVDYVSLNLMDYPRIVKQPMDFGTIQEKV